MNRTSLPIHEIIVENRQRQDLGDIASLANSLSRYGLIQPVVVSQDKRLIAGGRRIAAAISLNWTSIDVVYRETLTEDELYELELEENVRRKDMHWTERVLNIATIHQIKKRKAALDSQTWGQRQTADVLGLDGHASVNYSIRIAERLTASKTDPLWQCDSMMDAWRTIMRDEIDRVNAELAQRQAQASLSVIEELPDVSDFVDFTPPADEPPSIAELRNRARDKGYITLTDDERKTLYLSNPLNPPDQFEAYRDQRIAYLSQSANVIYISNMLIKGDSIKYMRENDGCFDHVITDIPYGIDMEMLNQQASPAKAMRDIDTVLEEHDVDYNMQLIADFFPTAYGALKENGFCITWCDQMLWQYMYDHAIKAGFKVQRWPIVWDKSHACMNQSAQFNFTKSTEIAIVCRKGKATLMSPQAKSVVSAGRDELCNALGHPFAKPERIWQFLADAVSYEGQLILEPFAGRGSGVISMLRMKRHVVGVELNENHYNALLENVKTQHFLQLNPNCTFK